MKIVYIAGFGHSGSTVLDHVLGQVVGAFSGGEIRLLWQRILEERLCACGRPFGACPIWSEVLARIPGGVDRDRCALLAAHLRMFRGSAGCYCRGRPAILKSPVRGETHFCPICMPPSRRSRDAEY